MATMDAIQFRHIILPELQLANSFYVQISVIIPGSARLNNNVRIFGQQSGDIAKYNSQQNNLARYGRYSFHVKKRIIKFELHKVFNVGF